jgi:hypothetical protein
VPATIVDESIAWPFMPFIEGMISPSQPGCMGNPPVMRIVWFAGPPAAVICRASFCVSFFASM